MNQEGVSLDNEMVDIDKLDFKAMGVPDHKVDEAKKRMLSYVGDIAKETVAKMSPPGTLGLPPLLEKRRLEWEIPDGVFRTAPGGLFDRILIWQIPLLAKSKAEDATFGGGLIHKSDQSRDKEQREAPRGVIVGAGLQALDWLRSHGVDLGHIVYFAKNTVYAIQVDYTAGKWDRVSIARGGDLILSEDLAKAICSGEVKVEPVTLNMPDRMAETTHYYVGRDGIRHVPFGPPSEDDL